MTTPTPAALLLAESSPTGAELPDPDRQAPRGLCWLAPLESRPIILGADDHPEVRPVLDIDADQFWTGTRHGLKVGRARIDLDEGACWYAFAPEMTTAHERIAFLVDATKAWHDAIGEYAREMAS